MLVNKQKTFKTKLITFSLAGIMILTASAVSAAQSTASLDGSSTSKNTATLTASGTSGSIYATNTGANTQTRGFGKRIISFWPDSTVAQTNWLNPGSSGSDAFTQVSGSKYYGQIVGQTVGSRGSVRLTVN